MLRPLMIILALLAFSPLVCAQQPEKKKEIKKAPKLEAPVRDESPSGHVAIEVVLKNGATFNGVAVKDRMVEKCIRHQYRKIPDEEKGRFGAGLRVWYYDDLIGFLFLPYRQIESVEIGDEYTVFDLERLKSQIKERVKKKEEARLAAARKKAAEEEPDANATAALHPLLMEYPPSEGFTPENFEALQRKIVVEDYQPSDQEKAWSKVFPDWLVAFKAAQEKPKKKTDETAKKGSDKGKKDAPEVEVKEGGGIDVKVPERKKESKKDDSPIRGLN